MGNGEWGGTPVFPVFYQIRVFLSLSTRDRCSPFPVKRSLLHYLFLPTSVLMLLVSQVHQSVGGFAVLKYLNLNVR